MGPAASSRAGTVEAPERRPRTSPDGLRVRTSPRTRSARASTRLQTLEYALDDFAISRLAAGSASEPTRRNLTRRSPNWANVFRHSRTICRAPRDARARSRRGPPCPRSPASARTDSMRSTRRRVHVMSRRTIQGLFRASAESQAAAARLTPTSPISTPGRTRRSSWQARAPFARRVLRQRRRIKEEGPTPRRGIRQALVQRSLTSCTLDPRRRPSTTPRRGYSWYVWAALGVYPRPRVPGAVPARRSFPPATHPRRVRRPDHNARL